MHGTGGPVSRLLAHRSPVPRDFYRYVVRGIVIAEHRYKKVFASYGKAPYLGPFPEMVHCADPLTVPASCEFLSISPKCKNLAAISSLKRAQRVHCTLQDGLLEQLAQLPKLRYLQVGLPRADAIPSFQLLQQITTLVVKCNRHQSSLNFLTGLDNLRSLCLSEAMGVTQLTPLGRLSSLCELYIDGTLRGRNTIQTLAPLGKLSELRFAVLLLRVEQRNRTLRHLHSLSKLAFLQLSNDYSHEEYDKLLAAIPRLKQIRFNAGGRWPRKTT